MQWMQSYPFYLLIGSVFGFYLSYVTYPYRKTPGKRYFWLLTLAAALAVLTTACELSASSFTMKLMWRNVEQIPLFMSGVLIYALSRDYVSRAGGIRKQVLSLSALVAVFVALIFTDRYHHLMRSSVGVQTVWGVSGIMVRPTLLDTAFIVGNQVLCLYAVAVLAIGLRNTPKHYRRQHLLLLAGILVPIGLTVLLPLFHTHIPGFTTLTFLPSGIILYYALFRHQLLSIWPIAKDKIFDNMKDGVLLVDRYGTIVEYNASAKRMLAELRGESAPIALGEGILLLFEKYPELLVPYSAGEEVIAEVELLSEADTCYEITFIPIRQSEMLHTGMLLILSDQSVKKRYERELIRQAAVDGLTGLLNRRHFTGAVKEMLDRNDEPGTALLILDIDDFKQINDTYGHQAGDRALEMFSGALRETFGESGAIGRIGGEEFAVCLHGLSADESLQAAEKFLLHLAARKLEAATERPLALTASIGVSYTEAAGTVFEDLYQQADQAMYVSKQAGKNRATLSRRQRGGQANGVGSPG